MPASRGTANGERVQLLPNVTVQEHLIDGRTAQHATRTAKRLCRQAEKLPFISKDKEIESFWHINTWGRVWQHHSEATIWHPDNIRHASPSFVRAVRAIIDFAQPLSDVRHVSIMQLGPDAYFEEHQDIYAGRRALLGLEGYKEVVVPHVELEAAETRFILGPGDVYEMSFTDDEETSLWHQIEYSLGENTVLYANTELH